MTPDVPNWLRIIIAILSFLSFLPQLLLVFTRRSSSSISTFYVLFNLLCATEQFLLVFYLVANNVGDPNNFVHYPRTTGDWINIGQVVAVFVPWLILFLAFLYFPSDRRDCPIGWPIGIYLLYLCLSFYPVVEDPIILDPSRNDYLGKLFWDLVLAFHLMLLNPIFTFLIILSAVYQAKQPIGSLSRLGLAIQAVLFLFVAVSWVLRLLFSSAKIWQYGFVAWYVHLGWAPVDNAIFALVQAALLARSVYFDRREKAVVEGEQEPLVSSDVMEQERSLSSRGYGST